MRGRITSTWVISLTLRDGRKEGKEWEDGTKSPRTFRSVNIGGRTIFDLILRYTLHLENYTIEACCEICHGHSVAHPQADAFTNDYVLWNDNAGTHARTHARRHARTHARTHACTHARTHARMPSVIASIQKRADKGPILHWTDQ